MLVYSIFLTINFYIVSDEDIVVDEYSLIESQQVIINDLIEKNKYQYNLIKNQSEELRSYEKEIVNLNYNIISCESRIIYN